MTKLIEHSSPYIRKLTEKELIDVINGNKIYGGTTIMRAMTSLSTIDPNFERTGSLLNGLNG